ncbi:cupin domain-containing protein [Brasilonema octagenarum UFV-E1]|uniref:Cupin domain-containing protein n=3 Tax=Scytonemataceae TaxID=1182 RepID=A0A856MN31_9CYAN|nr:cupin domain-containing protein [Brasilonema octagenarum UFV-OR1]QDL12078.1 cupin domain-containing protein [Brasilonema sennae CENA114]QDL18456.1 cupin domain-containing protein [Brasilonema octagenarum UFV-E1]
MRKASVILPLAILAFGSVVVNSQESPSPNTYTQSVRREVLASGYPTQDQKQILELVRYTIAPRTKLPTHIHPGMQIERVEAGTLTYTVVQGEAKVTKANGTQLILQKGKTIQLTVGDSLVEPAGMVHYGENLTNKPIILLSASLFDANQPKSILINPENR